MDPPGQFKRKRRPTLSLYQFPSPPSIGRHRSGNPRISNLHHHHHHHHRRRDEGAMNITQSAIQRPMAGWKSITRRSRQQRVLYPIRTMAKITMRRPKFLSEPGFVKSQPPKAAAVPSPTATPKTLQPRFRTLYCCCCFLLGFFCSKSRQP